MEAKFSLPPPAQLSQVMVMVMVVMTVMVVVVMVVIVIVMMVRANGDIITHVIYCAPNTVVKFCTHSLI